MLAAPELSLVARELSRRPRKLLNLPLASRLWRKEARMRLRAYASGLGSRDDAPGYPGCVVNAGSSRVMVSVSLLEEMETPML